MTDCPNKIWTTFFRFFGTKEHPVAAVKLSLGATAAYFWSAIDLWRSQGRLIGFNGKHEKIKKVIFPNYFFFIDGACCGTHGLSGGL